MIQAICWVLIHSLWQGLLFTIATGSVMLATGRKSAALRYRLICALFSLFMVVCAGTFIYEWRSSEVAGTMAAGLTGTRHPGLLQGWLGVISQYFSENASLIVLVWFVVFLIKCARMTGNLIYTQRIRHYGIIASPESWQLWMGEWCEQLGIRKKVLLLQSRIVKVPMVTGYWRPVVFMPLGLMTQLPAGEIEAILLHELAHIRRHDWLVNFLQHIAENIFFFNPALLWMSALLRTEREHCCDDLAIAGIDGDKVQFVQALVHFKEYDLTMRGLATAWLNSRNQLVGRVMRIAGERNKPLNGGEKLFFLVSMVAILVLTLAMGQSAGGHVNKVSEGLKLEDGKMVHLAAALKEESVAAVAPKTVIHRPNLKERWVSARDAHVQVRELREPVKPVAALRPVQQMVIAAGQNIRLTDQVKTQAERDRQQAERDRTQAELDRQQADRDRAQADRDREQAVKDREQSVKDRMQAETDRTQALKDRAQAVRDREQAAKDRAKADMEREQLAIKRVSAQSIQ